MNNKTNILKRIAGIIVIPGAAFIITFLLCMIRGTSLFGGTDAWVVFLRATASVMITTFALSINLNSGRFDFSIGSISLLSTVVSSLICIKLGLPTIVMLIISISAGAIFGAISGLVYVWIKLPPIIVSLGMALLYEGAAFTVTKGYGVSFVSNAELTSFPKVGNYIIIIVIALAFMIFIMDHTKFGFQYKALLSGQKVSVNTGIKEKPNTIGCYAIAGGLMGIVGFISATNTGTIQMSLNFGTIGVMFTAFLPMFIGGHIGKYCNDKIGYMLGAVTTAFISLMYVKLNVDSYIQQIITALILVGFLIYLNNENKVIELVEIKKRAKNMKKQVNNHEI